MSLIKNLNRFKLCILGAAVLAVSWTTSLSAREKGDVFAGPLPEKMAAWTDETKNLQRQEGRRLIETINKAVAAGEKAITIPTGHYRFAENSGGRYPAHVILPSGMEDVVIDFQGSTLWFETEGGGLVMSGAKRTTLRNVFLDWDPLPYFQGTVVAIQPEEGTFDVKLDPGYERALPRLMEAPWRGRGFAFDRATREFKALQAGCSITFDYKNTQPDGSHRVKFHGFYAISLSESGIAVGDAYVMLRRMQRAVQLHGAEECVFEDITLYASPFVAVSHSGGSAPTFRRFNIVLRPETNRLIAGNADGINCSNLSRGPLIEECRIENLGDDFVNVHGHLGRVLLQEAPDEIVTTTLNRRGLVTEPVEIEFRERSSMHLLGRRQATWESGQWKVDPERCLADVTHKWHSGDAARLAAGKTIPVSRLKLDRPIELTGDIVVVCMPFSSAGAVIRNNEFRGTIARGLRLQSPDVLVENNTIAHTKGPGITLSGQASFWGEGPYVRNATIRGNTFADTNLASEREPGQRGTILLQEGRAYATNRLPAGIRIEGNTFMRSGGQAIIMRGVDDLTVTGNIIDGYGLLPPLQSSGDVLPGSGAAIVLDEIDGLNAGDNRITNAGAHAQGEAIVVTPVAHASSATVKSPETP